MKRPSLVVLDVGHGNAAVLIDTAGVVVIDAGKGGVILDFLERLGIRAVDVLLISHADDDHVGSAPHLLIDPKVLVKKVYYNSDASKDTRSWNTFAEAIRMARIEKNLEAHPELTTSLSGHLDQGEIGIEILFPTPEMGTSAPGGRVKDGRSITSNSMSAAVKLNKAGKSMILLAGDVEQGCLDLWRSERTDPRADVLVFPHHGGLPGDTEPAAFATDLCNLVQPRAVIFSIHRTRFLLPNPDIIRAILGTVPGVRIACTQLSTWCARAVPNGIPSHILDLPAQGRESHFCCAGTIQIDLSGDEPVIYPRGADHLGFIDSSAESALCRGKCAAK
jgi:competence protein ComEC